MIVKGIDDITEQDLLDLIGKVESHTIDWKRDQELKKDGALLEFLRDVSSFANADGGDIVIGMAEDSDGRAKELTGISENDSESLEAKIVAHCKNHLEPPLSSARIVSVQSSGKVALIVRIPKSWSAPHQVTFQDDGKFYIRQNRNKALMNVEDLRRSFGLADQGIKRLEDFRSQRIKDIEDITSPDLGVGDLALLLHFLPLVRPGNTVDLNLISGDNTLRKPDPQGHAELHYNIDGIRIEEPFAFKKTTNIYRWGAVESAMHGFGQRNDRQGTIDSKVLYELIHQGYTYAIKIFSKLQVAPPIFACATLINTYSYNIDFYRTLFGKQAARRTLRFDPVMLDSLDGKFDPTLRPLLNVIAQAFGRERWYPCTASNNGEGVRAGR